MSDVVTCSHARCEAYKKSEEEMVIVRHGGIVEESSLVGLTSELQE